MTQPRNSETKLCRLQYAAGRVETCPESACPFWEPGGAALEGRCALEQLDLDARPELTAWLLRIRKQLETPEAADEHGEPRRLFYRLLNTGDADGG